MKKIPNTEALRQVQDDLKKNFDPAKKLVTICAGTGCRGYGCIKVKDELEAEIKKQNMDVEVRATGCFGFCEKGPAGRHPSGKNILSAGQNQRRAGHHFQNRGEGRSPRESCSTAIRRRKKPVLTEEDVPFYKKQNRLVFGQNGMIDPTRIEDYLIIGGYRLWPRRFREMTPEGVISEVKKAGLRGRGGGGFPAGVKWEGVRRAHGEPKYVIANGDEGDPGAYMDRSLMEGNPAQRHRRHDHRRLRRRSV